MEMANVNSPLRQRPFTKSIQCSHEDYIHHIYVVNNNKLQHIVVFYNTYTVTRSSGKSKFFNKNITLTLNIYIKKMFNLGRLDNTGKNRMRDMTVIKKLVNT